jgi:broad specificity phosphatase PhoE
VTLEAVYLARHGQTEWNVAGRRQGSLDSPLTPHGLLQTRLNAALLLDEQIDSVFASPLDRARSTAQILAEQLRLPVQVLHDLVEVEHGAWSGLTSAEIDARWPGQRAAREQDKYTYRFPDGESYADADVRAGRALAVIRRTGVRRPLLVSHEMIGRMLLKQLGMSDALLTRQPAEVIYRVGIGGGVDRLTSAE